MKSEQSEQSDNKFHVKCGFCRVDVTCNNGENLKYDTKWNEDYHCWLCHYCYVGLTENSAANKG